MWTLNTILDVCSTTYVFASILLHVCNNKIFLAMHDRQIGLRCHCIFRFSDKLFCINSLDCDDAAKLMLSIFIRRPRTSLRLGVQNWYIPDVLLWAISLSLLFFSPSFYCRSVDVPAACFLYLLLAINSILDATSFS